MRVGVLGLGSIGLRHAGNAIGLGHEVLGFDPDEARQLKLAEIGGSPTNRATVFDCERLVIATPTPHHLEDLKSATCPVLMEKPLGDGPVLGDLDRIILVGYNLRYHSCVRQALSWIKAGFIGKPLSGHFMLAQYNAKPDYLRDGVVLNWSHEVDLCLHLLGEAHLVALRDRQKTVADLLLEHKSGAVSSIHLNYVNKKEQRYFTILGDKGKIHCVLAPVRTADLYADDGSIYTYTYSSTFDEDYITEMKAFLTDNIGPGCTAQEAEAVLNICLGGL